MQDFISIGFSTVLLPLVGWTLGLLLMALVAGFVGLSKGRKRLRTAGRATGVSTLVLVLLLVVLLPLAAGYFGGTAAVQRSLAGLLDEGADRMADAAVDRGLPALKEAAGVHDDESPVDVPALRLAVQAKAKGANLEEIVPAGGGGGIALVPVLIVRALPQIFDASLWVGVDVLLASLEAEAQKLTWGELDKRARPKVAEAVKGLFGKVADPLRSGARLSLLILFGLAVVLHGGAWYAVRRMTRPAASASTARAA